MSENSNDDLKARMKAALDRKQGHDNVEAGGHHKQKGPAERGRQGGATMFRRKAGG